MSDTPKKRKLEESGNGKETNGTTAHGPKVSKLEYSIVYTKDMKKSVAFYKEFFNFTPKWESNEWTEGVVGTEKATSLAVHLADDKIPSGQVNLCITVPDSNAFHEQISKSKDVEVVSPPAKQEWGGKKAEYISPDGLHFSTLEETAGKTHEKSESGTEATAASTGNGICHIDIPVDDLTRASKFYTDVFGWKCTPTHMENYVLFASNDSKFSVGGGLTKREHGEKLTSQVLYLHVCDIDAHLEKIKAAGGHTVKPKFELPNVGFFATFKDTEDNLLSLYSR